MNRKIEYRRGFLVGRLILCLVLVLLELAAMLYVGFSAAGALFFAVLLCTAARAVHLAKRVVRKTGCFSVWTDGIHDAAISLSIGPFRVPFTVGVIPWRCVRQFRCDHGKISEIRLVAAERNEFPPNYPFFEQWLICGESERNGGAVLDTRWASCRHDTLTEELEALRIRAGSPRIVQESASFFAREK